MTYEFDAFCSDCRGAYEDATGVADLEIVRQNLERLIKENPEFVEKHCHADATVGANVIYTDDDKGFIVYAHIIAEGRKSPPHDHGASWAVYGQARKFTDMTEYDRLDDKSEIGHAEIKESRQYRLDVGMAGKFGPHDIHQIHFEEGARFIRVTGSDLYKEDTLTYDPTNNAVTVIGTGSAADNSQTAANA
jgi:predicted metal-dependent enzyme (double-stranded beta helix superfamily)